MDMKKSLKVSQYAIYYGLGLLITVFFFEHQAFYHFPPDFSKGVPLNWMAINVGAILFTVLMIVLENAFEADDRWWLVHKYEKKKED